MAVPEPGALSDLLLSSRREPPQTVLVLCRISASRTFRRHLQLCVWCIAFLYAAGHRWSCAQVRIVYALGYNLASEKVRRRVGKRLLHRYPT